jgi:hypothetical protein
MVDRSLLVILFEAIAVFLLSAALSASYISNRNDELVPGAIPARAASAVVWPPKSMTLLAKAPPIAARSLFAPLALRLIAAEIAVPPLSAGSP